MVQAFLSLGSNTGDRQAYLRQALRRIQEKCGNLAHLSSVYQTESWGFSSPDIFLNLVAELHTELLPEELLSELLGIEKEMGRDRRFQTYENRNIDIDILFYGNRIIFTPVLTIPHPLLHKRLFVLVPLNEIAPFLLHPRLKKTVEALLKECSDKSLVERFSTEL